MPRVHIIKNEKIINKKYFKTLKETFEYTNKNYSEEKCACNNYLVEIIGDNWFPKKEVKND